MLKRLSIALIATAAEASLAIHAASGIGHIDASTASIGIELSAGRCIEARLLAAADGRRSPSREMMGIKTVGWAYQQTAIVTTISHSQDHQGVATQHFLEAGPFAILPLSNSNDCSACVLDSRRAQLVCASGWSNASINGRRRFRFASR